MHFSISILHQVDLALKQDERNYAIQTIQYICVTDAM